MTERRRCDRCGRPWWIVGAQTGVGCLCHVADFRLRGNATGTLVTIDPVPEAAQPRPVDLGPPVSRQEASLYARAMGALRRGGARA